MLTVRLRSLAEQCALMRAELASAGEQAATRLGQRAQAHHERFASVYEAPVDEATPGADITIGRPAASRRPQPRA